MTQAISSSPLQNFWKSLSSQERPEVEQKRAAPDAESSSSSGSFIEWTIQKINWFIENRGGLASLTGLVMVPSQCMSPHAEAARAILAQATTSPYFKLETFTLPLRGSDTSISGVIYIPNDCDLSESRCVLYHNPNGITISGYFEGGNLSWTPADIAYKAKCPIIMYDYRGTGLSSENVSLSSLAFRPTYESIVVDGEEMIRFALVKFDSISVVGSSLGGGVATVALERHLKVKPHDTSRVTLMNHDSFSTTPKVVMPNWPTTASWLGWAVGGILDAETAMKSLVKRGIPITVLCHQKDPVIPEGARMAEFVETLEKTKNVSIIYSPYCGHANLSPDMMDKLHRI